MSQSDQFDNFFITIVKETGGIEGLLHSLHSFLLRRTDFYYEMSPGDKMGFPPGDAEKMVNNTFKLYQNEHYKKFPRKSREQYDAELKAFKEKNATDTKSLKTPVPAIQKPPASSQQKLEKVITQTENITENPQLEQELAAKSQLEKETSEHKIQQSQSISESKVAHSKKEDISTYNGGKTEKYKWTQNVNDIEVQIDLPMKLKSKDLIVDLTNSRIHVSLKSDPGHVIISGEFYDTIKRSESSWNIEDGDRLMLVLEKSTENIWKTIIKGDQEIDATKVDNTKDIADFDDETQGALRKIMHEQKRKQMGLPTTEEEQQLELMKKAWNAEGSPFKGTPFDPSKINLGGNSTGGMPPGMGFPTL